MIPNENESAYLKAQKLLKDWGEGYIPTYKVFTTEEQVRSVFPRIIDGCILNMLGNKFFWKRTAGEPLILYGKNDDKENLKDKGVVELCRFQNFPAQWVGVGRFCIDWAYMKDKENGTHILIQLYLSSINGNDFEQLLKNDAANAAYMSTLSLGGPDLRLFYQLAKERFESLE